MAEPGVLIVGAGPTGLVLACELAWRGVPLRIIDRAEGPSRHSKALGVMPRTLELLENHGVSAELVRRGSRLEAVNVYGRGRRMVRFSVGMIDSAYPYALSIPQAETERVLLERLEALGVRVEWYAELTHVTHQSDAVEAVLRAGDGTEERIETPWLVGCDGADSSVRQLLGIPFEGERYREAFNLADLEVRTSLSHSEGHSFLEGGLFLVIPLPDEGRFRLVADEPPGSADVDADDPTVEDFRRWLRERAGKVADDISLGDADWVSRFRISRRIVPSMRHGRVFLAGDAAHVHSPAGGQGMNNGIQDAVNLGWKLALVMRSRAHDSLLDSYDPERLPVAHSILANTHRLTGFATLRNPVLATLRACAAGIFLRPHLVQRRLASMAAELLVTYRNSPVVEDHGTPGWRRLVPRLVAPGAPAVAGDRAPDPRLEGSTHTRLYEALAHQHHTLLLLPDRANPSDAERAAAVAKAVRDRFGDVVRDFIADTSGHPVGDSVHLSDPAGVLRKAYAGAAVCLIRPDRYVAFRGATLGAGPVCNYLERMLT